MLAGFRQGVTRLRFAVMVSRVSGLLKDLGLRNQLYGAEELDNSYCGSHDKTDNNRREYD
jgi:hypothetical protein